MIFPIFLEFLQIRSEEIRKKCVCDERTTKTVEECSIRLIDDGIPKLIVSGCECRFGFENPTLDNSTVSGRFQRFAFWDFGIFGILEFLGFWNSV